MQATLVRADEAPWVRNTGAPSRARGMEGDRSKMLRGCEAGEAKSIKEAPNTKRTYSPALWRGFIAMEPNVLKTAAAQEMLALAGKE